MTQAPSLKEALDNSQSLLVMVNHVGPNQDAWKVEELPKLLVEQITENRAALATFQPDGERREAIALIINRIYGLGLSPYGGGHQDKSIDRAVNDIAALLASGLVQNEAGIRAEEREKIRNRLDSHLNDFLCGMKEGWDDSVSGFNDAWDVVRKVFDVASTRSARDGGAET